ncbi:unnamed protein product [Vitrella brassicaformis CCMP3155]|uniref:ACB domain-containing protein n=2 Tax=Vitrella brassicaformis TaxID=1169539 RepID=A0A0G4EGD3_VITBC|nr:unnamed protein product [Vitrella brassicaformis CCMP3155]|eukprot:CEL94752.1 unnamed protein product [Vitrella brassicaformis CCMP3155]
MLKQDSSGGVFSWSRSRVIVVTVGMLAITVAVTATLWFLELLPPKRKRRPKRSVPRAGVSDDFDGAAAAVRKWSHTLSTESQLSLYALYKQAIEGDCLEPSPSPVDVVAIQKWRARQATRGLPRSEASERYVEKVRSLVPQWEEGDGGSDSIWLTDSELAQMRDAAKGDGAPPKAMQGGVSMPAHAEGDSDEDGQEDGFQKREGGPGDKVCRLAAKGDLERLKAAIDGDRSLVSGRDSQGMTALHFAADRGHEAMAAYLIQQGSPIDAQDDNGETPLHIAVLAEQAGIVRLLLSRGASSTIKNNDNQDPLILADESSEAVRDALTWQMVASVQK